ncbi:GNAT family N-acetyltransferase [Flexibacterium corallicola]|uniref:GNAT family N-acetyltransferase n=1 Tax=Flexibacterium corallicola TaxID=3037259 RepID=UPI00286F2205|nr:GNAT family N-acetyltransferase [Pseudovibrio sp. M1P-2-3]
MSNGITISHVNKDGIDRMLNWALKEGWSPGLDDTDAYFATDPEGFLCLFKGNEPVSIISAVRYNDHYGFLGFYICHPDYRGMGYGKTIWDEAIKRFGARTVGLDGVVEQQDNYAKSGFATAHSSFRYSGVMHSPTPVDSRLHPIGTGALPDICAYDRKHYPVERERFLKIWHQPENKHRFGFFALEDGKIVGYGTIRACHEGHRIGPLFAESEEIADLLYRALCGSVQGQTVMMDIPEPNTSANRLVERYNLNPSFETARMYKGPAPDLPLNRIYGLTTLELG